MARLGSLANFCSNLSRRVKTIRITSGWASLTRPLFFFMSLSHFRNSALSGFTPFPMIPPPVIVGTLNCLASSAVKYGVCRSNTAFIATYLILRKGGYLLNSFKASLIGTSLPLTLTLPMGRMFWTGAGGPIIGPIGIPNGSRACAGG